MGGYGTTTVCGYRFSVKHPISRAQGRSAVNSAAYNAREALRNERTGTVHDYRRGHSDALFKGIFLPADAPEAFRDRETLWNEVERVEGRKNSQLARPLEISLPHMLDQQQQEWVLKDFVRENFTRKGMIADVALHAPDMDGDERNYHAHVLLTLRGVDREGFTGNKVRAWNSREALEHWREDYAEKCARMLERAGFEIEAERWRYGHMTLGEQTTKALEREDWEYARACLHEAGTHRGPIRSAMQERGIDPREPEAETPERAAAREMRETIRAEIEKMAAEFGRVRAPQREGTQAAERQPAEPMMADGAVADGPDILEPSAAPDLFGNVPDVTGAGDGSQNVQGTRATSASEQAGVKAGTAAEAGVSGVLGIGELFGKIAEKVMTSMTSALEGMMGLAPPPPTKAEVRAKVEAVEQQREAAAKVEKHEEIVRRDGEDRTAREREQAEKERREADNRRDEDRER